jgi:tRNA pseudouridine55 synthase
MYSALKRDGKPLYEYARAGQTVEREGRNVTILALEMIACALPDVTFRVTCTKGTYVRTLAEDIGEALGCGAHLVMLRRTGVGALTLDHAVTLDALNVADEPARDAWLQPVDALLSTFPLVTLDAESARRFTHGQRLPLNALTLDRQLCEAADRVRVYDEAGRLLGVAKAANGVLAPEARTLARTQARTADRASNKKTARRFHRTCRFCWRAQFKSSAGLNSSMRCRSRRARIGAA